MVGVGVPVALHSRVMLAPSCTITSPEVFPSTMLGGTVRKSTRESEGAKRKNYMVLGRSGKEYRTGGDERVEKT